MWARLQPPAGRRPVAVVTRSAALDHLGSVVVAPLTSTIRAIASEVPVGVGEGLPRESVINCDQLVSVVRSDLDEEAIGTLGAEKLIALDRALRFALGITF